VKDGNALSYLFPFYYTASHSWGMAGVFFVSGTVLFSYRLVSSKKQK